MEKQIITTISFTEREREELRDAIATILDLADQSGLVEDKHEKQVELVDELRMELYN